MVNRFLCALAVAGLSINAAAASPVRCMSVLMS